MYKYWHKSVWQYYCPTLYSKPIMQLIFLLSTLLIFAIFPLKTYANEYINTMTSRVEEEVGEEEYFKTSLNDTKDISDVEDICLTIRKYKKSITRYQKWRIFFDALKLKRHPWKFAIPDETTINVKPQYIIKNNKLKYEINNSENVIFALGPIQQEKELFLSKGLDKELNELQTDLRYQINKIRKLLFKVTLKGCRNLKRRIDFDDQYYKKLLEKIDNLKTGRQIIEEMKVKEILDDVSLQLKWKVITATDLDDVFKYLYKENVANVIIISHGMSTGTLVDSMYNTYPINFFYNINPRIFSISFYSCYSKNIIDLYNLEKFMSQTPSFYSHRYVYTVQPASNDDESNVAPLQGLSYFLTNVDDYLAYLMNEEVGNEIESNSNHEIKNEKTISINGLDEKYPKNMCCMNIDNFKVKSGTLGLLINNYYIGSSNEYLNRQQFDFPCDLIKKDGSSEVFVIRNLNLYTNSSPESLNFIPKIFAGNCSLMTSEKEIFQLKLVKHYTRLKDGGYRSSKYFIHSK
ncbi:MAG: hypothetical protein HQK49_15325 [Oligoflexia bacterium]|nr:hypothetical protein [Oligoflexia bacterium]